MVNNGHIVTQESVSLHHILGSYKVTFVSQRKSVVTHEFFFVHSIRRKKLGKHLLTTRKTLYFAPKSDISTCILNLYVTYGLSVFL